MFFNYYDSKEKIMIKINGYKGLIWICLNLKKNGGKIIFFTIFNYNLEL